MALEPGAPPTPISPKLSRQLDAALGKEAAEELVNWMHDVDAQRRETGETLRADVAEVRQEMRAEFANVRQEMRAEFAGVRQEMQAGFATLHAEIARLEARVERRIGDLIKWSFVFWVGAVGAIAMLARALG